MRYLIRSVMIFENIIFFRAFQASLTATYHPILSHLINQLKSILKSLQQLKRALS